MNELNKSASDRFYEANGYYATEEDAIRLTDEARAWFRRCDEIFTSLREEFYKTNGYYPAEEDSKRLKKESEAVFIKEENEKNRNRSVDEIFNEKREAFYNSVGHYPADEDHIRLDAIHLKERAEASACKENK